MLLNFLKCSTRYRTAFIFAALILGNLSTVRAAEIDDSQTIGLFTDEKPAAATSPIPRPTSKIAENVTVITSDDIARLNAHTLAEVLQTVPGIQLDINQRTPGTFTFFNIQGALNSTILVLIDGIRQNDFDQDIVSPGRIPVQQIERIEIVKGAASGSWGSALGGVINIVTKSPNPDRPLSGMVSASIGGRFTADSRGELSSSKNNVGYYLTAGRLRSDGLSANTSGEMNNLYGKVAYTLPGEGSATVGVSHIGAGIGEGEGFIPPPFLPQNKFVHQDGESDRTYGFLKLQQPVGNSINVDILGYLTDFDEGLRNKSHDSSGRLVDINHLTVGSSSRGANASVSWGDSRNNVVGGMEYAHVHADSVDRLNPNPDPPFYDRSWDSYAAYVNGSYSIGRLAVLPGIRFDSTGFAGDHTSYTLGVTYEVAAQTTLRAYAAKGFSLPLLSDQRATQKVRTVQGGIESGALPHLWLKGTYFFNELRHSESLGPIGSVTSTDQDRQGFELEARTTPLFGLSLSGGYTYLYAVNDDSDQRLHTNGQQTVPPQVYKIALDYDDNDLGLRGKLTGSGVVWNSPPGYPSSARGMVWDLHLNWKPRAKNALCPELFFSAHNLFNGVQSTDTIIYTNASRWFEGGARVAF